MQAKKAKTMNIHSKHFRFEWHCQEMGFTFQSMNITVNVLHFGGIVINPDLLSYYFHNIVLLVLESMSTQSEQNTV